MDPLVAIGIFMLGASAGSLLTHIKLTNQRHALDTTGSLPIAPSEEFPSKFKTRAFVGFSNAETIAILAHFFRELRIHVLNCDRESEATEQLASARFDGISVRDRVLLDQTAVPAKVQPKSELTHSRSANGADCGLPSQEHRNVSL